MLCELLADAFSVVGIVLCLVVLSILAGIYRRASGKRPWDWNRRRSS